MHPPLTARETARLERPCMHPPQVTQLLEQHSRRRLGPLEEEQVELGSLLGRGSYGRVYRGAPCSAVLAAHSSLSGSIWKRYQRLGSK